MNKHIDQIQSGLGTVRQQVVNHPSYQAIQSLDDIRIFMEHHIYAVWDFMSLLKALQNELTCTQVPWFPVGSAEVRYLINEIVCGEESDLASAEDVKNGDGIRKSHFELYLDAMEQVGASTAGINALFELIQSGKTVEEAIELSLIPESAKVFLRFTFEVIATRKPHIIAAVFTFGREDLIPNMFHTIVSDLNAKFPTELATFKFYLDRHIEVDGDHHGHLALQMVSELCGNDPVKWEEAENYSIKSLEMRKQLWDGVLTEIQKYQIA
jgi:pyrroloquinoline quinone (PQQ) biosynthesis protein C